MNCVYRIVTGDILESKRHNRPALNPKHGQTGWKLTGERWVELIYSGVYQGWLLINDFRQSVQEQKARNRKEFSLRPYEERRRIMHHYSRNFKSETAWAFA